MKTTIYEPWESRELVELTLCRETATELEIELAQRFEVALDMLEETEQYDTRRQSKKQCQA